MRTTALATATTVALVLAGCAPLGAPGDVPYTPEQRVTLACQAATGSIRVLTIRAPGMTPERRAEVDKAIRTIQPICGAARPPVSELAALETAAATLLNIQLMEELE